MLLLLVLVLVLSLAAVAQGDLAGRHILRRPRAALGTKPSGSKPRGQGEKGSAPPLGLVGRRGAPRARLVTASGWSAHFPRSAYLLAEEARAWGRGIGSLRLTVDCM